MPKLVSRLFLWLWLATLAANVSAQTSQRDQAKERAADFRRVAGQLLAQYPNEMQSHYFAAIRAAMDESLSIARRAGQRRRTHDSRRNQ